MESAKSSAKEFTNALQERYCGDPYRHAMAALDRALRLRQLSLALSSQAVEPGASRVSFAALRRLQSSRPLLAKGLRMGKRLGLDLSRLHPKLKLWAAVAGDLTTSDPQANQLLTALQATDAWKQAAKAYGQQQEQQIQALWNHRGRLEAPDRLIQELRLQPSAPLFFWHHYDSRGLIPRSWMAVLLEVQGQGWQVVVSSSRLAPSVLKQLRRHNIAVQLRTNIGLCLGAYRDFCCLLSESEDVVATRPHLALANDSTLPVGGAQQFVEVLAEMTSRQRSTVPQLNGITDSIERDTYHLQSYLLLANSALTRHTCWQQFWRLFDLAGSKDDLINTGELGLSQALLGAGVRLEAQHSVVGMLLEDSSTNSELARFEVREPRGINLSLYAWQALLRQGCPVVKKQVLFNLRPYPKVPIPLSELKRYLKEGDVDFQDDLEDLIRSRYLKHG